MKFSENVKTLIYKVRINYIYLGAGRYRQVYLLPSRKFVVKVPINMDGVIANDNEYKYWKNRKTIKEKFGTELARCRLYQGPVYQDKLLVMEYVSLKHYPNNFGIPDWVFNLDAHQVGYDPQGKLVAYDYGSQDW